MEPKAYFKKVGNIKLIKEIGKGSYGKVYEAEGPTNQKYAVKAIKIADINQRMALYLEKEIDAVKKLNHPHIMQLKELYKTAHFYYLVFEYCNRGDLDGYRKAKGGSLDELTTRYFFKQIIDALCEIHKNGFVHRDIKLPNIMLIDSIKKEDLPIAKIGDFGFARNLFSEDKELTMTLFSISSSFVGTPLHMSPEILSKKPYNYLSDIWSMGTILFQLITGTYPFFGITREQLREQVEIGTYKIKKTVYPSPYLIDFLTKCLQYNQSDRIRTCHLLKHPFLTCSDEDIIESKYKGQWYSLVKQNEEYYLLNTHDKSDYLPSEVLKAFSTNICASPKIANIVYT